jgi:hypothetical protein
MAPVFAEPISDKTGLKKDFEVDISGTRHVIETVSNFDIQSLTVDQGKLVFEISSSLSENFGEIQIPNSISNGTLQFTLDGTEISPKVLRNERISFATLEFVGNGTHTLQVGNLLQVEDAYLEEPPNTPTDSEKTITIIAVVAIVGAIGAASSLAFYLRGKKLTR